MGGCRSRPVRVTLRAADINYIMHGDEITRQQRMEIRNMRVEAHHETVKMRRLMEQQVEIQTESFDLLKEQTRLLKDLVEMAKKEKEAEEKAPDPKPLMVLGTV